MLGCRKGWILRGRIGRRSSPKKDCIIRRDCSSKYTKKIPDWQKTREKGGKNMATGEETAKAPGDDQAASPWAAAFRKLREWAPAWAEQAVKMTTNPWREGVLPTKFI